jgi:hypothetical protein
MRYSQRGIGALMEARAGVFGPFNEEPVMTISRSAFLKAAAAAGVALAAMGTASVAQARSDVFFSIGANVAPGVSLGVSNAPYYAQPAYVPPPVYYQPAPVYYQPAPVYYQSRPVYYPPVYVAPPVYGVTYVRPWGGGHRHRNWR